MIRRQIAAAPEATSLFGLLLVLAAWGQAQPSINSHEVHPDGSITLRFVDPAASKVLVHVDGLAKPLPMEKDKDGVWSTTTSPLPPQIYGYGFEADGESRLDPNNAAITPNLIYRSNMVLVHGSAPQLWEAQDVPHGLVHHHFYTSRIVQNLEGGQSDFYVYTPPGYDSKKSKKYPVLYLLHGWSDLANGWSEVGQANLILDNLIAQRRVRPMIVVMPLGYGDMKFVTSGDHVWDDDARVGRNVSLFSQALLTEILPRVEVDYRASKSRDDRAITGLSMGGLESLTTGLTHSDKFGWVGGFSSALGHKEEEQLGAITGKTVNLHLLWIACGTEDDLITNNRHFITWLKITWLKSKDLPLTAVETPGMHNWMVWRDNLVHFAPLLFQKK